MSLSSYRNTAAEIAAAAVFELFPEIELLGGGETSVGFYYDLSFPHPIHSETLPMIEQQMRQIIRERREIRLMEMVPLSAREFLKAHGHPARAAEVGSSQLVCVVQIGSFCDLSPSELLKNTHQLSAFKLEGIEPLEGSAVRLFGYACESKEELKSFLKKVKEYARHRHEVVGEIQGLWKEGVWLEKGLKARERLLELFEKQFEGQIERISAPQNIDRAKLLKELGRSGLWQVQTPTFPVWDEETGLLKARGTEVEIFCLDRNFPLRSIENSLNILGLKYNGDFAVSDALGRVWPVVERRKSPGGMVLTILIDRILALSLESTDYPMDRD